MRKSANIRQKHATQQARDDVQKRKAASRPKNLERFFKGQAVWGGQKPPIDQIYEEYGVYPDAYQFVVFVGPRGQGKGIGHGQWIEAQPADSVATARQIASEQPQDDPVLVLDLDTGTIVYESYPDEFHDEDGNEREVASHPWLNTDDSAKQAQALDASWVVNWEVDGAEEALTQLIEQKGITQGWMVNDAFIFPVKSAKEAIQMLGDWFTNFEGQHYYQNEDQAKQDVVRGHLVNFGELISEQNAEM